MDNFNIQSSQFNPPFNNPLDKGPKKFFTVPRIIFGILGLVILVEVGYVAKGLISPAAISDQIVNTTNTVIQTGTGSISLSAPKTIYKVKDNIPVSVTVDTGSGAVDGVDVIVKYDPKVLEVTKEGLVKGNILNEYPLLSVDTTKGLISISGISNEKNGFKGAGSFATINFQAKASGKTSLLIDFQKGLTTDSNLVANGVSQDILEQVNNLELNIL